MSETKKPLRAVVVNRAFMFFAEKFYSIARWCEGRAIAVNTGLWATLPVFGGPNPADFAGHMGFLKLDPKNKEVRAGLIRGYNRSPKGVCPQIVGKQGDAFLVANKKADYLVDGNPIPKKFKKRIK